MDELRIELRGEEFRVPRSRSCTFGREADLVLARDARIASVAGTIWYANGLWWIRNDSHTHLVRVADRDSDSVIHLAPGSENVLAFADAIVRVLTDVDTYTFGVRNEESATSSNSHSPRPMLNSDQRLLLVALAEPTLRAGLRRHIPTNREIAARLGWTQSKLIRKIDNLAIKLERFGVVGLRGGSHAPATDRRTAMVDYAISSGLISVSDLAALEEG